MKIFLHLQMSRIDLLLEAVEFIEKNEKGNSSSSSLSEPAQPRTSTAWGTREVHNKLEKNRRAHLKECFERLKNTLPSMDKKSSNLYILQNALRTVQELRRRQEELVEEQKRLEWHNRNLEHRLRLLTGNTTSSPLVVVAAPSTSSATTATADSDSESTTTASECGAYSDTEETTSAPADPSPTVSLLDRTVTFQNAVVSTAPASSLVPKDTTFPSTQMSVVTNGLKFYPKCIKMVQRAPATVTLVPSVVVASKPLLQPATLVKAFPAPKSSLVLPAVVNGSAINMGRHVALKPLMGSHIFPSPPPMVVVTSATAAAPQPRSK